MLTGGTLVLLAAFTPWALLRMLPLHEVASAAAGGLSHAPKQALSSAADTALELRRRLGRARSRRGSGARALPDGEPSILEAAPAPRGGPAAAPARSPTPSPGWAEPVDADVAEPVATDVAEPVDQRDVRDELGRRSRTGDRHGPGHGSRASRPAPRWRPVRRRRLGRIGAPVSPRRTPAPGRVGRVTLAFPRGRRRRSSAAVGRRHAGARRRAATASGRRRRRRGRGVQPSRGPAIAGARATDTRCRRRRTRSARGRLTATTAERDRSRRATDAEACRRPSSDSTSSARDA